MIVVDASALLAIYLDEPERTRFLAAIAEADAALLAPVNAWEALAKAQALHGPTGRARMTELIEALGLEVPPCTFAHVNEAADAFARHGRPSPAGLNLGDCFAYGLARRHGAPLLFKGADFARTDITPAG